IDSIGQSIFSPSESGKHQYLTIQGEENIRATRNALIRQVTGKEN
ncbi:nucleoside hydrolase, partial [Bacteroides thetaiotaomicron]